MRRSNSLSHIPVRTRGSSIMCTNSNRDKIRSTSVGRYSKESTHLIKSKRTLSPENQLIIKQTPLNRQRSLLRATPASIRSASSSRSRISPTSALIERKTIQKLSTNKTWVARQYEKVQNYIVNSGLFDENMVTIKNIKPPSIKVFVYTVTVLLGQLFPNVKITMENYKEEIPRILKTMNYPGTLTKSTLKTVNTMHSWPQVIGIIGWLVDKVTIVDRATVDISEMSKEEQHKQISLDYLLMRYDQFCSGQGEIEEINNQFFRNLAETLGVDTTTYFKNKNDYDKKCTYRNTLQTEVEELELEKKVLEKQYAKILDELNDIQGTDADKEAAVDAELNYFPVQLEKLIQKENELMARVVKLEASIKIQPCTYQEKREMLDRINAMNNELNIYKEKKECAQRIKEQFETRFLEEREKLQSRVIAWNRALMLICIKKPHLKQLLLKETGFHRDEFLQEIVDVVEKKIQIENEEEIQINEIERELNPLKIEIETLEHNLKEIQSDIDDVMEKFTQFCENTNQLKNNKVEKMKAWELEKRKLLSNIKDLKGDKQVDKLNEEFKELGLKREQLCKELDNLKKNGVKFFIDLHKIIRNNTLSLANILEGLKNKAERVIEVNLEEKNDFILFLESLNNEKNPDV
ncbi:kinetochore protein NDC80 homolog [Diorhabda sublineata]|uniref:kinetochore protein NDC80 homolog n=1 Tax=Diorhabda sublineata TaxID=1163346 RepID=UPI0024E0536F|nr:kinetochore protein NDC80 homolog [Diorhabda sublineata]XP_056634222.1 kinetochore protein NDC80 homolog [Diorhabda sublineata]